MSKATIKNQIESLKKKFEKGPKVRRFRGRRVVPIDRWQLEDWTMFPDQYHMGFSLWLHPPQEWWKDYLALLWKLEDPTYAWQVCVSCAAQEVGEMKKKFEKDREHWARQGGKEKFYQSCEPSRANQFRLQDAIEQMKYRILNEHAGANNRTCTLLNFFKCPYGKEYAALINAGRNAEQLFTNLDWYHSHWHKDPGIIPSQDELKWYHFNDPEFIDLTNYDDIIEATKDGRIQKIAKEREAYHKDHTEQPPP